MSHTIVMTGASRGLGYQAALSLLREDPDLYLAVTTRGDGGEQLAAELAERSGNPHVVAVPADLSSIASIRAAVLQISTLVTQSSLPPIDGFVGNAGLQLTSAARHSDDGLETTFAVNVVANYLFVQLLEPLLVAPSRVVLTTSDTHFGDFRHNMAMVPAPAWTSANDLSQPGADTAAAGRTAYSTSKLGVIYLTHALARNLPPSTQAFSFNPGLVPGTGLVRDGNALTRFMFRAVMPAMRITSKAQSAARAGNQLAAVISGKVSGPSGSYVDRHQVARSSDESFDVSRENELWLTMAALTGAAA